ncbi:MAG: (d)CMP kinase [Nitrospirota bacterium]
MSLIITIDGPAAAGKSSVAKALAKQFHLPYLESGSLYRAMAWMVLQKGVDPNRQSDVETFCNNLHVVIHPGGKVFVDQEDVTDHLRLPEVSRVSSVVSAYPKVREKLLSIQRNIAQNGAVVEGRDTGTVIFPEAQLKFFLDADLTVRGERRYHEMVEKGTLCDQKTVLDEMKDRDDKDSHRVLAPLCAASDAVIIDSTNLSLDTVIDQIIQRVAQYVGCTQNQTVKQ